MNVLIFGATGRIGQGVLSECLLDSGVEAVTLAKPLLPMLRWAFPNQVLTTERIGRAMLQVARPGAPKRILESPDSNAL